MPTPSKTKKQIPINIQLKGIEVLDACINHPKYAMPELKIFHFEIKLEHKINTEKKFIAVLMYVDVYSDQIEAKLGSLTSSCIFDIADFDISTNSKNKVVFPDEFLTAINSISISTTRGIMYNQFKGTFLHNALLPIVDPKSLKQQK